MRQFCHSLCQSVSLLSGADCCGEGKSRKQELTCQLLLTGCVYSFSRPYGHLWVLVGFSNHPTDIPRRCVSTAIPKAMT
jgi:hypothetical protein